MRLTVATPRSALPEPQPQHRGLEQQRHEDGEPARHAVPRVSYAESTDGKQPQADPDVDGRAWPGGQRGTELSQHRDYGKRSDPSPRRTASKGPPWPHLSNDQARNTGHGGFRQSALSSRSFPSDSWHLPVIDTNRRSNKRFSRWEGAAHRRPPTHPETIVRPQEVAAPGWSGSMP